MDVVRSSTARYRVPEDIPSSSASRAGSGSDSLQQPMPVSSAILWTPTAAPPPIDPPYPIFIPAYPIFITQRALAAVHDHVAARPQGSSTLGFLVGDVFLSPSAGKPYIVVTSTIQVPWSICGDHLKSALTQGRAIAEEEVRQRGGGGGRGGQGGELVGWYHGHGAAGARLSSADVDAHLACFDQPWHVALVVGRGAELAGGVFRIGADVAQSNTYLPFYELLDADSVLPDGRKITDLAWTNYRTQDDVLLSDRTSQPDLQVQPRLLFPDDAEPVPTPARRRFALKPVSRVAGIGVLGMVAAAAFFGLYRAIVSRSLSQASGEIGVAARSATAVATPERIDRLADTVALAVAAFDLRVRLLEMSCADLARGLVDLEERWTAYNVARQVATLDSVRNARDRALYAEIGDAQRRFERLPCPRP